MGLVALAGCISNVEAEAPATVYPTSETISAEGVATTNPVEIPTPPPSVPGNDKGADNYICEEPVSEVMSWLSDFPQMRPATWTPADVSTVLVGSGNNSEELWWIVAVRDYNVDTGKREDMVFLTNAPSPLQPSGETWIRVDEFNRQFDPGSDPWQTVRWPNDRIAKGQRAEAVALNCLL